MRLSRSVSLGIPLSASLLMFASAAGAQAPARVQPTAVTTPADQVAQPGKSLIRQAQQELQKKGYDPGPRDGILGPRTQTAIKGYQQAE
jgi:peptidoglycan hydrolase-like protein with peptidoglycan-binding domain